MLHFFIFWINIMHIHNRNFKEIKNDNTINFYV
jgi:hypothetical protein